MPESDLTTLPGVGPATADKIRAAGFETVEEIVETDTPELLDIPGIGFNTVKKWKDEIKGEEFIQAPPSEIVGDIILFYEDNKATYRGAWSRLDQVKNKYLSSPPDEQEAMIKASYVNAIISQQTQVHLHEEAWQRWIDGEPVTDAMKAGGVQYYDQKGRGEFPGNVGWIHDGLANEAVWEMAREKLEMKKPNAAHEVLLDSATGLSQRKAPFTLANLGFTQKMCIDTNVGQLFRATVPDDMGATLYADVCREIVDWFPDEFISNENLRPYEVQWLVFDFYRVHNVVFPNGGDEIRVERNDKPVAQHDIWFTSVTSQWPKTRKAVRDETLRALGIDDVTNPDEDDLELLCNKIESEVYDLVGHEVFMAIEEEFCQGLEESVGKAFESAIEEDIEQRMMERISADD